MLTYCFGKIEQALLGLRRHSSLYHTKYSQNTCYTLFVAIELQITIKINIILHLESTVFCRSFYIFYKQSDYNHIRTFPLIYIVST